MFIFTEMTMEMTHTRTRNDTCVQWTQRESMKEGNKIYFSHKFKTFILISRPFPGWPRKRHDRTAFFRFCPSESYISQQQREETGIAEERKWKTGKRHSVVYVFPMWPVARDQGNRIRYIYRLFKTFDEQIQISDDIFIPFPQWNEDSTFSVEINSSL